eukprot:2015342-Amphidinium_carterae.1
MSFSAKLVELFLCHVLEGSSHNFLTTATEFGGCNSRCTARRMACLDTLRLSHGFAKSAMCE